jgi:hypothetical protein
MIVFFGAEFTKQYATHYGRKIEPGRGAELIEPDEEKAVVGKKKEAVHEVEAKEGIQRKG